MSHVEVDAELRALSERYARGADRRDGEAFAGAFAQDAVLVVHQPGGVGEPTVRSGIEELQAVPSVLMRYEQTFHFLGQSSFTVSGDTATGEVYCIAHHLHRLEDGRPADRVLYVRYEDEYAVDGDGAWRIRRRDVHINWATVEPVGLVES